QFNSQSSNPPSSKHRNRYSTMLQFIGNGDSESEEQISMEPAIPLISPQSRRYPSSPSVRSIDRAITPSHLIDSAPIEHSLNSVMLEIIDRDSMAKFGCGSLSRGPDCSGDSQALSMMVNRQIQPSWFAPPSPIMNQLPINYISLCIYPGVKGKDAAIDKKIKEILRQGCALKTISHAKAWSPETYQSSSSLSHSANPSAPDVGGSPNQPTLKSYLSNWANMARGYSTHWIVLEKGMLGWVLSLFFYVDLHYIHDMDFSAFLSYYHDQNNEGKTLRGSIVNIAAIEKEANFQEKEAHSTFGMLSGDDPAVAPLRRALAVWGLNIDVIGVASSERSKHSVNDSFHSSVSLFDTPASRPITRQKGRIAGATVYSESLGVSSRSPGIKPNLDHVTFCRTMSHLIQCRSFSSDINAFKRQLRK
ncbi:exodeoxyribonuclease V, partial [Puccinia sorghi]